MEKASHWTLYSPTSIWHYLSLIMRGRRLQKPGSDWHQLGGDVLVDPEGILRMYFVSTSPHDRPTVAAILDVVRQTR